MVGRITVTQSFTSNLVVAVKTETQEVLVLSESILSRVDGVLCEGFFFFFNYYFSISRVLSFLILNRCERKL